MPFARRVRPDHLHSAPSKPSRGLKSSPCKRPDPGVSGAPLGCRRGPPRWPTGPDCHGLRCPDRCHSAAGVTCAPIGPVRRIGVGLWGQWALAADSGDLIADLGEAIPAWQLGLMLLLIGNGIHCPTRQSQRVAAWSFREDALDESVVSAAPREGRRIGEFLCVFQCPSIGRQTDRRVTL